jgi:hypothetical protein
MSVRQSKEAWLVPLPGREKLVLLAESDPACEFCGLAWPGNRRLAEMTGLGRTALHEALKELKRLGLLEEIAYGQGGRGCSTVVRVLPAMEYCAAPCPKCVANLERPKAGVPRKLVAAQTVRKPAGNPERKPSGNREGFRERVRPGLGNRSPGHLRGPTASPYGWRTCGRERSGGGATTIR